MVNTVTWKNRADKLNNLVFDYHWVEGEEDDEETVLLIVDHHLPGNLRSAIYWRLTHRKCLDKESSRSLAGPALFHPGPF